MEASTAQADRVVINVTRPLLLRFYYGAIAPELATRNTLSLNRCLGDGFLQPLTVDDRVTWGPGMVEWPAASGEYELR